jgi:hypothetical protein
LSVNSGSVVVEKNSLDLKLIIRNQSVSTFKQEITTLLENITAQEKVEKLDTLEINAKEFIYLLTSVFNMRRFRLQ